MALRGWSPADIESADPLFLEAVYHALYAERMAPILSRVEETLAMDTRNLTPDDRVEVARAKVAARQALPQIRRALMLEDDTDG